MKPLGPQSVVPHPLSVEHPVASPSILAVLLSLILESKVQHCPPALVGSLHTLRSIHRELFNVLEPKPPPTVLPGVCPCGVRCVCHLFVLVAQKACNTPTTARMFVLVPHPTVHLACSEQNTQQLRKPGNTTPINASGLFSVDLPCTLPSGPLPAAAPAPPNRAERAVFQGGPR